MYGRFWLCTLSTLCPVTNGWPKLTNVSKDACFAMPGSGTGYFTIHML